METSSDGSREGAEGDARARLAELDAAAVSTRAAGYPPAPGWYSFALATLGPVVVAVESQAGAVRSAAVVGAAVLFTVVGVHDWRRRQVRPIRVPRSRAQIGAASTFTLVLVLTLFLVGELVNTWPPVVVAVVSYVWLLATFSILGRRLEQAMVDQSAGSSMA